MFFAYTIGQVSDESFFDTQISLLKKFEYWGFSIPKNVKLLKSILSSF